MRRLLRLLVAWGVGWIVSLVAALLWAYDGVASLIFQPVCAAVVSTVCVGVVLLAGLVLHVHPVGRLWYARRAWAGALALACIAVMCFGSAVGLTGDYADPETGRTFVALHPAAALFSYLGLLFTLAHWPAGSRSGSSGLSTAMKRPDRERRLRIFETAYGRAAGWYVEHHGRRLALLTDPRFEEMFWESYRIEPLTAAPEEAQMLTSRDRWLSGEFVFRNREFGEIAENAFAAGQPFCDDHRVLIRGLYLGIDRPSVWERLLLWYRGSRQAAWKA
jgi:hypothetical protein